MKRRSPTSQPAFGLIELMVVISLILVLIGIVFAAGVRIRERQKVAQTKILLANLQAVATEYEVSTGRKIPHFGDEWNDSKLKNAPGATGTAQVPTTIERFFWVVNRHPATQTMVRAVGKEFLVDKSDNGFIQIVDAWGTPLAYVVRVIHDPQEFTADDFLPESNRPYFASAGPDGQFGDHRELRKKQAGDTHDADLAAQAEDNLYSFELD